MSCPRHLSLSYLRCLFAILVVSAGCIHRQASLEPSSAAARVENDGCRFGANYGSGMVAIGFPPAVHAGLAAMHDDIAARQPDLVAAFMADQPYAPHASLIYGVTPEVHERVAVALADLSRTLRAAPVTLGELHYWDDAAGGKTTLVVAVDDPTGVLLEAHSRLQALIGRPQRFPYTPHVTLAYLRPCKRLPVALAEYLQARLRQLSATPRVMWLTDACGLARGYEALAPAAPSSPAAAPTAGGGR